MRRAHSWLFWKRCERSRMELVDLTVRVPPSRCALWRSKRGSVLATHEAGSIVGAALPRVDRALRIWAQGPRPHGRAVDDARRDQPIRGLAALHPGVECGQEIVIGIDHWR